jgi:hypothetical protein
MSKRESEGKVYRPTYPDLKNPGQRKTQAVYHIRYWDPGRGKERQESSGSTDPKVAERLLWKRLDEIAKGSSPPDNKTTLKDLMDIVTLDYKKNGLRSLPRLEDGLHHIVGFFGEKCRAIVVPDRIDRYIVTRQEEGQPTARSTGSWLISSGCSAWASRRARWPSASTLTC